MASEQNVPNPGAPHGDMRSAMFQMVTAYRISQMLYVAARLGIADLLKDGPKSPDELAEATGTHARSLYRMLRALASKGVFAEDDEGRFGLTPLAEQLRSDLPGSAYAAAVVFGHETEWRPWGELLYSIRTGEMAFRHLYGTDVWEYRSHDPQLSAEFDRFMTFNTVPHTRAVVETYNFSGVRTVVDVAGGRGTLIAAILKANPHLRGILCDAPHVIVGAGPLLEAAGVRDRCELEACNFFESVPSGGDLYIVKSIIHDWDDEQALAILRTCRREVPPHGRLLLVENVIPPGNEPHLGKITDVQMLVELGGRERTESEFADLLERAGFRLERVMPMPSGMSIIKTVPV